MNDQTDSPHEAAKLPPEILDALKREGFRPVEKCDLAGLEDATLHVAATHVLWIEDDRDHEHALYLIAYDGEQCWLEDERGEDWEGYSPELIRRAVVRFGEKHGRAL